jgi:hypothetical protein
MATLQVVRNSQEYPQGDVLGRPVYDASLNRIVVVKEGSSNLVADVNAQSVSATGTMSPQTSIVIFTGTSTYAYNLPATAGLTGRILRFKKTGASGVVTLTPATGTIDGAATLAITAQYRAVEMYCDGTNFHLLTDSTPAAG